LLLLVGLTAAMAGCQSTKVADLQAMNGRATPTTRATALTQVSLKLTGRPLLSATPVAPKVRRAITPIGYRPAAIHGHGELAVVDGTRLGLLGGPLHHAKRLPLGGTVSRPVWSFDGRWLAVRVRGNGTPARELLLSQHGKVVRHVGAVQRYGESARWSPIADQLLVDRPGGTVDVVGVQGGARRLPGRNRSGGVWSPDGSQIAVSIDRRYPKPSTIEVFPVAGGAGREVVASPPKDSGLELAGWWPDGSGLIVWVDLQHSQSLAADGLPLDYISLATGQRTQIAKSMLVHDSWIASSATTNQIAIIEGGNRELSLGHKSLATCTTTTCTKVAQPRHTFAMDPGVTSTNQLAVVRDRAIKPTQFGPPYIRALQHSGGVNLVSGSTADPAAGLGRNATSPVFGRDGSVLALRGHDLVLAVPGHRPRIVVKNLSLVFGSTYYGFVPWLTTFAWSDAIPGDPLGTT
jgi:hypothetical protein